MNISVTLNWKSFLAIGLGTGAVILACKADGSAAEKVSANVADACKAVASARVAVPAAVATPAVAAREVAADASNSNG